jgi:HAD superfamily hydrolase (TIGR01549 family)
MPSRAPYDAVVFDLDDTLIDWWTSISDCLGETVDERCADALLDYCRRELWLTSPSGDHVWHRNTWALHYRRESIWPEVLDWLPVDEVLRLAKRFDEELWVGFFPHTVPTLDAMLDSTRLAVLSNNHLIDAEAQRLRLHDWFEACLAAPRDTAKPHPEAFMTVCNHLGVAPERTVYVGDSIKSDVFGALEAGLIPVWHDVYGDPWADVPAGVHRIANLGELPALLGSL